MLKTTTEFKLAISLMLAVILIAILSAALRVAWQNERMLSEKISQTHKMK